MINTTEMKRAFLEKLDELEQDTELLKTRIATERERAKGLPDEVDEQSLERFDEEVVLEEGLKHIRLF
ncbi:MAG: hypothetical protein UGF89_08720 [Acutalibacteraceae bacterium]|nr:hypothetical protein [Acutalibacteraceae bacterium]